MNASRGAIAHFVAILLAGLLSAHPAGAALLGKTLGVTTQFPNVGDICCGSFNVVVGAGIELAPGSMPLYNVQAYVDASDSQIEYGQTGGTTYTGAAFNGFRFHDVLGSIDSIVGVSINGVTDLAGFDLNRLSFDANNIFINMQGLVADAGHRVVLDVRLAEDGQPAVEPASLALFGLGLGLLAVAGRCCPRQA